MANEAVTQQLAPLVGGLVLDAYCDENGVIRIVVETHDEARRYGVTLQANMQTAIVPGPKTVVSAGIRIQAGEATPKP